MAKNTEKNAKEYNKNARAKYSKKYNKEMIKTIGIKCNIETEYQIIHKMETVSNKSEYIKTLIRKDITKDNK